MPEEYKMDWERFRGLTILEMIQKRDECLDKEGNLINRDDYWDLTELIAWELQLATYKDLEKAVSKLQKAIDELKNQFEAHRHKTIGGLFTDVPTRR